MQNPGKSYRIFDVPEAGLFSCLKFLYPAEKPVPQRELQDLQSDAAELIFRSRMDLEWK